MKITKRKIINRDAIRAELTSEAFRIGLRNDNCYFLTLEVPPGVYWSLEEFEEQIYILQQFNIGNCIVGVEPTMMQDSNIQKMLRMAGERKFKMSSFFHIHIVGSIDLEKALEIRAYWLGLFKSNNDKLFDYGKLKFTVNNAIHYLTEYFESRLCGAAFVLEKEEPGIILNEVQEVETSSEIEIRKSIVKKISNGLEFVLIPFVILVKAILSTLIFDDT